MRFTILQPRREREKKEKVNLQEIFVGEIMAIDYQFHLILVRKEDVLDKDFISCGNDSIFT